MAHQNAMTIEIAKRGSKNQTGIDKSTSGGQGGNVYNLYVVTTGGRNGNLDYNEMGMATEAVVKDMQPRTSNATFMAKNHKCSSNILKPVMGLDHKSWLPLPLMDVSLLMWIKIMLPISTSGC